MMPHAENNRRLRTITLEEHFATPEYMEGPGRWLKRQAQKQLPVSDADRERIAHKNAEDLLRI